jgi:hypothetical protein
VDVCRGKPGDALHRAAYRELSKYKGSIGKSGKEFEIGIKDYLKAPGRIKS